MLYIMYNITFLCIISNKYANNDNVKLIFTKLIFSVITVFFKHAVPVEPLNILKHEIYEEIEKKYILRCVKQKSNVVLLLLIIITSFLHSIPNYIINLTQ